MMKYLIALTIIFNFPCDLSLKSVFSIQVHHNWLVNHHFSNTAIVEKLFICQCLVNFKYFHIFFYFFIFSFIIVLFHVHTFQFSWHTN